MIKVTQIRIASKEVLLKVIDLAVGAELDLPTTFYDILGINSPLIMNHSRNFKLKVLIFYCLPLVKQEILSMKHAMQCVSMLKLITLMFSP